MKTLKALGLSAAVLGATAVSANADSVTYSGTILTQTVGFTQTVNVNGFQTSLGTLTGITIDVTTNTTAILNAYNFGTGPGAFSNAFASIPIGITGPGDVDINTTNTTSNVSASNVPPGLTTYPGLTATGIGTGTVAPAQWSDYESSTPITVSFTATAGGAGVTAPDFTPGMFFSATGSAGGTISITYDFDAREVPAPIPGTGALSLAFFAMAGLGPMVTKRLKRNRLMRG